MSIDPEHPTDPKHPVTAPLVSLPPPQQSDVFFGRFGLRAGWSLSFAIVLYYVLLSLLSAAVPWSLLGPASNQPSIIPLLQPAFVTTTAGISFLAVALTTLVLSVIERRAVATYGIGLLRLHDVLPGAFWGVASLSLLVAVLHACHLLVFDFRTLAGHAIVAWAARWLLAFLFVALFEEYLIRGYLQFTLTRAFLHLAETLSPIRARALAFWIAALISSTTFAILHLSNGGETPFGLCIVFLVGMVFSYALWRTGSLWWAIGFHMAWDWAQSFLYGVPDSGSLSSGRLFLTHPTGHPLLSGGIDGPEGSLLVVPTLLLVLLVLRYTTQPGIQPPLLPRPSGNDEPHRIIA